MNYFSRSAICGLLSLAFVGCIPIFTGEGEEVKSVEPTGISLPGVPPIVSVTRAHTERHLEGVVEMAALERNKPLKYVKVCLFSKKNDELGCATTDTRGIYKIKARLPRDEYVLKLVFNGVSHTQTVKIGALKEIKKNLLIH